MTVEQFEKDIRKLLNEPIPLQLAKINFTLEYTNRFHNIEFHKQDHCCSREMCQMRYIMEKELEDMRIAFSNILREMGQPC